MKSAGNAQPVFDAAAVLALIQGKPGAEKLQGLQENALVDAVNAAEVPVKLVYRGMPPAARQAFRRNRSAPRFQLDFRHGFRQDIW